MRAVHVSKSALKIVGMVKCGKEKIHVKDL